MKELMLAPRLESVGEATAFVEEALLECGCPMKIIMKMNIVADELFSNIARYSGASETRVLCGVEKGSAVLRLSDDGKPYDPTAQREPDTALSAEARGVGGLGIHMVKKLMDTVEYSYIEGKNTLTVRKSIS